MSKPVKDLITRELAGRYRGVDSACVVDLTGLDAVSTHRLRGGLRSRGIRLQVVKNRIARRAFAGTPLEPLGNSLDGPCALATGGESVVDVAKELTQWAKELPALKLKQAIVEGDPALVPVEELARWKSRSETLGEVVLMIASPGRRLAGCLAGPGGRIAGCVRAIVDKLEKSQGPEASAA